MYKNLFKTKKRLLSRKIKGNVGEPKELWKASIPRVTIQDNPSLSSFSQGWRKVFFDEKTINNSFKSFYTKLSSEFC